MAQHKSNGHAARPTGPWVNVATICTEFVRDLMTGPTLRGIMTGATIGVPEEARAVKEFEVDYEATLVLTLSGGEPLRAVLISIDTDGEDGQRRQGQGGAQLRFDADGILRQPISLKIALWGEQRYWFNVLVDGRLITRVPFQVRYEFERR